MQMFPEARVLDVDLTTGKIKKLTLPSEVYRLYPGGSALGCYLIMREKMDPMIDPCSPDALMVFSASPTVGLPVSGNSRLTVTAKSPLTGCMGDAQGGGFFPAQLRTNGWDAILFRGRAQSPVYLYIDNDEVSLRDASSMWGKETLEAERLIKEDLGDDKLEIAEIGPAGENLVKFACILSRGTRANGRNGLGAVMGSKNLKAVACKRQKPRQVYDKENFFKVFGPSVRQKLDANATLKGMQLHGTDKGLEGRNDAGFLMTRNWQTGYFPEGAHNITGATMTETVLVGRETCHACAVQCKRMVEVPEKGVVKEYGGPEYETAGTFGSYCGVSDFGDVCVANQYCNALGVDTISAGATIAFAMECYEKGIINDETTGGIKLNFGNGAVFAELITQIARRSTPFGDLLAEGSYRVAKKLGNGAEKLFMGAKKQEFPAHMPQEKHSLAVHYAVNPYGADHQSVDHDPSLSGPPDGEARLRLASIGSWKGYPDSYALDDEKMRHMAITQRFAAITDILNICQFVWGPSWQLYGPSDIINLLRYGIGCECTMAELLLAGERRINMMRYFNFLAGMRPETDDTMPDRIFEPMPEGPAKGHQINRDEAERARQFYYALIGSDPVTGRPSDIKLRELSLQWMMEGYEGNPA